MGRCKSVGECFICSNDILTYDEYEYCQLETNDGTQEVIICIGMDPERTDGEFYESKCMKQFTELKKNIETVE